MIIPHLSELRSDYYKLFEKKNIKRKNNNCQFSNCYNCKLYYFCMYELRLFYPLLTGIFFSIELARYWIWDEI